MSSNEVCDLLNGCIDTIDSGDVNFAMSQQISALSTAACNMICRAKRCVDNVKSDWFN